MNLDAIGNVGDFLGGIGVVVTLIYLAIQIRRNTIEVRNAAVQRILEQSTDLFGSDLSSRMAEIGTKRRRGEEISEVEEAIAILALRRNVQLFEQVYLQFLEGRITQEVMDAYERRLRNHFSDPMWSEFWKSLRRTYTDRFSRFVDTLEHDALRKSEAGNRKLSLNRRADGTSADHP